MEKIRLARRWPGSGRVTTGQNGFLPFPESFFAWDRSLASLSAAFHKHPSRPDLTRSERATERTHDHQVSTNSSCTQRLFRLWGSVGTELEEELKEEEQQAEKEPMAADNKLSLGT